MEYGRKIGRRETGCDVLYMFTRNTISEHQNLTIPSWWGFFPLIPVIRLCAMPRPVRGWMRSHSRANMVKTLGSSSNWGFKILTARRRWIDGGMERWAITVFLSNCLPDHQKWFDSLGREQFLTMIIIAYLNDPSSGCNCCIFSMTFNAS